MSLIVAVASGPPAGDAVDQHAAVGQHDARAFGPHHGQRRASGFHLGIRQPDVRKACRMPVGRPVLFAGIARHLALCATPVNSLDQFAQAKLDDLQRRHLRRALAETLREDGIWVERDGKRLLSFSCNDYLNLTQHPAIKQAAKRRDRAIRRGLRRLAAGHRQSPALRAIGIAACAHQADRSRRRVRLRLSRQCRHHPGADRARRAGAGGRTVARLPVRRRAVVARHRDNVSPQRCRARARPAGSPSRRARPRADRHRRRVLHGRRSRPARRSAMRSPASTTPG